MAGYALLSLSPPFAAVPSLDLTVVPFCALSFCAQEAERDLGGQIIGIFHLSILYGLYPRAD